MQDQPQIWVLEGPKAGDNTQMRALAKVVGGAVTTKQLVFRPWELLLHVWPQPTLAALDEASRVQLEAPWPDLVITGGRRNELVARWIRDQSGGRCRLVHIGRPWSHPDRFDLIISTPQYPIEAFANVLMVTLPLSEPDAARTDPGRYAQLPGPRLVLLIGGNSGPHVFTRALAKTLARRVSRLLDGGGALLVSTSARTPRRFVAALRRRLREVWRGEMEFFDWHPDAQENPYRAFLACGDAFVVTSESMSMVGEACATGKPVFMVDVAPVEGRPWWLKIKSYRWRPLVHRVVNAVGPRRMRRDVRAINERLVAEGRARWLDDAAGLFEPAPPDDRDRRAAGIAVSRLLPGAAGDQLARANGG
jgi:mitochondrial fission protein ELM1